MTKHDETFIRSMLHLNGNRFSKKKWRAARYLEKHGSRFCIELGTDNVLEVARQLRRERKHA